jgi:signal transduction protein with GAF and PtsI domain
VSAGSAKSEADAEKARILEALNKCNAEIDEAKAVLLKASVKEYEDTQDIYEKLSSLEKLMRQRNKLDEGKTVKCFA